MKKVVVIYWSGTGNTEAMAAAVAGGAEGENTEVTLLSVADASLQRVIDADGIALGCPSMGDEVLEEAEMEPFITSVSGSIAGKAVVLFGSYGWGEGQWMQDWVKRMKDCGANVLGEGLIIQGTPDGEGLEKCKALGRQLSGTI